MEVQRWTIKCDVVGRCVIPKKLRDMLLDTESKFDIIKKGKKYEVKRNISACAICANEVNKKCKIVNEQPICDNCIELIKSIK